MFEININRYVVVNGDISTSLSENVGEIDGEAFHKASEALERAKKESMWIVLGGNLTRLLHL